MLLCHVYAMLNGARIASEELKVPLISHLSSIPVPAWRRTSCISKLH